LAEGWAVGVGPGVAWTPPKGVTIELRAEYDEVPLTLVALTAKLYPVPLVSPASVVDSDLPETVTTLPPGEALIV